MDDRELASAVGPGEGIWTEALDDDLELSFGWVDGRFLLRVERAAGSAATRDDAGAGPPDGHGDVAPDLGRTFEGAIMPEATPNPRTLAFRTGPLHDGESRSYSRGDVPDDPRVARLFSGFDDVVAVMVARDFVAITVRRPDRWEPILASVLDVLNAGFAGAEGTGDATALDAGADDPRAGGPARQGLIRARPASSLDLAWAELGGLDPSDPTDLDRLVAAARDPEVARRQVAANRLAGAPDDVAATEWERLIADTSRLVRRAAVDAIVDVGREFLRPLLERALGDPDAWVRWKALRGLAELGAAPSRAVVAPLASDRDFRVRLEAEAALRR